MATYAISGYVMSALGLPIDGVTVTTSVGSATTDTAGAYSIAGHAAGAYTVTPTKTGLTFSPSSKAVTVVAADLAGNNFVGVVITYGSDLGVEALNKERNYDAGTVTRYDLAMFREAIEAEMDARLAQAGYVIPVTATVALKILFMISNLGVAAMAEDAQFGGEIAPDQTTHAMGLWKLYREWLDRYTGKDGSEPEVRLPGATLATPSNISKEYPRYSASYTNTAGDSYQIFSVNTDASLPEVP